jgi:hypothetical protein
MMTISPWRNLGVSIPRHRPGAEAALVKKSATHDAGFARPTQTEGDGRWRDAGLLRETAHKTSVHHGRRLSTRPREQRADDAGFGAPTGLDNLHISAWHRGCAKS